MKTCPKCHTEIDDNARFCLYCMTSLEEKQLIKDPKEKTKRWIYMLIAVLVFMFIIIGVLMLVGRDNKSDSLSSIYPDSQSALSEIINDDTAASEDNLQGDKVTNATQSTTSENNSKSPNPSKNSTNTFSGQVNPTSSGSNKPQNNATSKSTTNSGNNTNLKDTTAALSDTNSRGSSVSTNVSSGNQTSSTNSNSKNSTIPNIDAGSSNIVVTSSTVSSVSSSVSQDSTPAEPSYSYVAATIENTYPTGYSAVYAPENSIVITKVNYMEKSGNYVIPDTIDGKKVTAIMPSAFCDADISSTVKSITLPGTVRTLWNDAFKDCYNLKDIYIKSATIEIYTNAFPEENKRNYTLTIHCTKNCRNFQYYYYKNIADKYGAEYEEWNG